MIKKLIVLTAIMALFLLPALAQGTTAWCGGGNGNGGNGNGGNGNGGNGNGGNGGNGNGGNGNGGQAILNGTPFSFNGTVVSIGVTWNEIVVSTAGGSVTLNGLGSYRYWEELGVERPVVGDSVSGNGYTVDYSGLVRNVLTDITVNGVLVQLRGEDGRPLWRGNGGNGGGPGNGDGSCDYYTDILNGTPFTVTGEVISGYVPGAGTHLGNGLVITTDNGNVQLNGLGPRFYWENLGVTRPVVGDTVSASGYTVDFNGTVVNVLMALTLDNGTVVQLRDPATGVPLWRNNGTNTASTE